jgi:hypothetical protein
MSYSFDLVCWFLDALYCILGLVSFVQISRLHWRDEGISFSCACLFPATIQQLIHLIILTLCGIRIAFFICAIHAWDPETGTIYRSKLAFYTLDEVSNVLLFSLTSILALFWAEIFYISIDRADIYLWFVRPLTYFINIAAFIGVFICSCIVSSYYADEVDYVFLQYTILITSLYLFAAVMFTYYAYMAAIELEKVPIAIMARRDRLFSLRALALISIFALVLRGSVLIYLNGKSMETESSLMICLVFLYFFLCEIFPMLVILIIYRLDSLNHSHDKDDDTNVYIAVEQHKNVTSRTPRSISPMRQGGGGGGGGQPEVIDAIIARLSLETGSYKRSHADNNDNEPSSWADSSGEEDSLLSTTSATRFPSHTL